FRHFLSLDQSSTLLFQLFGYPALLPLTRSESLFRQLAFRELMSSAYDSIGIALKVNDAIASQPNPGDRAVRPNNSAFEIVEWFSIHQLLDGFLDLLAIVRMHTFQPCPRLCEEAFDCPAPNRFVGTIDEQNLA